MENNVKNNEFRVNDYVTCHLWDRWLFGRIVEFVPEGYLIELIKGAFCGVEQESYQFVFKRDEIKHIRIIAPKSDAATDSDGCGDSDSTAN